MIFQELKIRKFRRKNDANIFHNWKQLFSLPQKSLTLIWFSNLLAITLSRSPHLFVYVCKVLNLLRRLRWSTRKSGHRSVNSRQASTNVKKCSFWLHKSEIFKFSARLVFSSKFLSLTLIEFYKIDLSFGGICLSTPFLMLAKRGDLLKNKADL